MSKKNKNKDKIEKNSSNFSEGGFDKSILSNYSQWREEYSEKEIPKEEVLEEIKSEEVNKAYDLDFKSNLINSEIEAHTFSTDKENKEINSEKKVESVEENNEEDEILTETQRLKLIYGNVVPLHERRRRGSNSHDKKKKNKEKKQKVKNVSEEVEETPVENIEKPIEIEKKENVKPKEVKAKKEKDVNKYEMPKVPKMLKMIFAFTIIFALSIVGFFGLKAYHSLGVKLPNILSGVESKKIGFYTTNMVFNGKTIDKNKAESFIALLEEDELRLTTINKWLREDAENLKKDENYKSERPVRLQKSGKILGIFDDYKICLDPVKLKVEKK